MTSQKPKKLVSIMIVLTMILTLLPATLGLAASYESIEQFVKNVYEVGLGREADEGGFNYWVKELEEGRPAAEFIGYVLLDAPEFKEKYEGISNDAFVKKAYEIVFNREADEAGLKFWKDEMSKGGSQKYVIVAMLYAPPGEFKEFCEDMGIKLGTIRIADSEKPGSIPAELKVVDVSANNLKEVEVRFNQPVDEESATDLAHYSFKSGKTIKLITLSKDQRTAKITLEGIFTNNKADALNISNVTTNGGEKVLNEKNISFTAVDNTIPAVDAIKSLGTKSLKVTFSEPIKDARQNNFTLDGKAFFGKVTVSADWRSVVITPYNTSALAAGDHTLVVSNVKDYANFVSLSSSHSFVVIEDKEAPTVTDISATLETVTITFSEEVDPDTVSAGNVYWKSGNDKIKADSKKALADDKYEFTFGTNKSLPTGSVLIYVEGVKDYSGNEIAKDTKLLVTPTIDMTRPEVKKVEVTDSNKIKVTFSKAMLKSTAEDIKNYAVLDKDDKVISVQSASLTSDPKVVVITLYKNLSVGKNTLTIKNLRDSTKLQNTMLDYSGTVTRSDKDAPTIDSYDKSNADLRVIVKFNKKMDTETLADYKNYLVRIDGKLQALSADFADIDVIQDATAVVITFPDSYNNKLVSFTKSGTNYAQVTELHILGVKDAAGNLLNEFVHQKGHIIDLTKTVAVTISEAKLTNEQTIEVKFSTGIDEASISAFTCIVNGNEKAVRSVEVDGSSKVKLKFDDNALGTSAKSIFLRVDLSGLKTMAGENAGTGTISTASIKDAVAPKIVTDGEYPVDGNSITIEYSEPLKMLVSEVTALATDFKVVRISDNKELKAGTDYTAKLKSGNDKKIEITLNDSDTRTHDTKYTITVKGARYFVDDADNAIRDSEGTTKTVEFDRTLRVVFDGPASITVPGGTTPVTVKYTAEVRDRAGKIEAGKATWSVVDASVDGVSVDAEGTVTVTKEATAPSFKLRATFAEKGVSGEKTITLNPAADAKAAKVVISGPEVIEIPADDTANEKPYTAKILDQYDLEMSGKLVVWDLDKPYTGISVDTAGKVSVEKTAAEGDITLVATHKIDAYNYIRDEIKITVKKAAPEAKSMKIIGKEEIAKGTAVTETYTVEVLDQYGIKITNHGKTVTWSLKDPYTGVTIADLLIGKVTIEETAEAGTFTLVAKSTDGKLTAELPVEIKDATP